VGHIATEELQKRVTRAKKLMMREKFDALVVYADEWRSGNVYYFVPYRAFDGLGTASMNVLLLPIEREPTLFVCSNFLSVARQQSWFSEVESLENLSYYLTRFNTKSKPNKVGIVGRDFCPFSVYEKVKNALNGVEIIPSDIVTKLRSVKTEAEIELMKEAGRLADRAMEAIEKALSKGEGKTEKEIVGVALSTMMSHGADAPAFEITVQSGPNSVAPMKRPTDRKIVLGEPILVDLGARFGGYSSDIGRSIAFGKVTSTQKKIIETANDAFDSGLRLIKPGMKACDVHAAIVNVVERAGYGDYFPEATGHGIGIDGEEELPALTADNKETLEVNMTLALKAAIFVPGVIGTRIEDDIVLRKDGPELLTNYPRRLYWRQ